MKELELEKEYFSNRKARIYFNDGTGMVRKKDVIVLNIRGQFIHFFDRYDNKEQIIPMYRIYRIIFMGEEK